MIHKSNPLYSTALEKCINMTVMVTNKAINIMQIAKLPRNNRFGRLQWVHPQFVNSLWFNRFHIHK
jgi:hypothetical protein